MVQNLMEEVRHFLFSSGAVGFFQEAQFRPYFGVTSQSIVTISNNFSECLCKLLCVFCPVSVLLVVALPQDFQNTDNL